MEKFHVNVFFHKMEALMYVGNCLLCSNEVTPATFYHIPMLVKNSDNVFVPHSIMTFITNHFFFLYQEVES